MLNLKTAIEEMQILNRNYPEINRIGLNIELKCSNQYKNEFGIDVN